MFVSDRLENDRCGDKPSSANSSCDPVVLEEVQPESDGTINDIDEKDRLAVV